MTNPPPPPPPGVQPGQPGNQPPAGPWPVDQPPAYGQAPGYGPYGYAPYGYPAAGPQGPPPIEHPKATTILVIGVLGLSLGFSCGIGFLASPVAWVMGQKAKNEIDRSGRYYSNRGQVIGGWVCGIIGSVILFIAAAIIILALALGG